MSSNITGNTTDRTSSWCKLLLPFRQVLNVCKVLANYSSVTKHNFENSNFENSTISWIGRLMNLNSSVGAFDRYLKKSPKKAVKNLWDKGYIKFIGWNFISFGFWKNTKNNETEPIVKIIKSAKRKGTTEKKLPKKLMNHWKRYKATKKELQKNCRGNKKVLLKNLKVYLWFINKSWFSINEICTIQNMLLFKSDLKLLGLTTVWLAADAAIHENYWFYKQNIDNFKQRNDRYDNR